MRLQTAVLLLCLTAAPAAAHPHMFIDATFEVVFDDQGRAAALRIGWIYDELTTLMIVEDGGDDKDGDGAISAAELETLKGFDMDWGEDFLGDTYARMGGAPLAMTMRPEDWTTDWQDGRLISSHTRRFDPPVEIGSEPLVILPYDPGYYAAYAITGKTVLTGREGCRAEVFVPDIEGKYAELVSNLQEYTPDVNIEELGFPNVGEQLAEELRVTCAD
jgi:ABC-type uncharacterized transport system substrate-binding protein